MFGKNGGLFYSEYFHQLERTEFNSDLKKWRIFNKGLLLEVQEVKRTNKACWSTYRLEPAGSHYQYWAERSSRVGGKQKLWSWWGVSYCQRYAAKAKQWRFQGNKFLEPIFWSTGIPHWFNLFRSQKQRSPCDAVSRNQPPGYGAEQ